MEGRETELVEYLWPFILWDAEGGRVVLVYQGLILGPEPIRAMRQEASDLSLEVVPR